jgi:hypothetical protein
MLMDLVWHIRIAGAGLLGLAACHLFFGKRFNWKEECGRMSLLNRQIFYVHCFFIALTVGLMGTLSLMCAPELVQPSPLARALLIGLTVFWGLRLLCQWFVYDAALWRGHRFNTFVHVVFSSIWLYLTTVYGIALAGQF